MARRDVELIIKAQDQASTAIKAVTSAIDTLGKEQKEAAGSAGGVDTRLQALASAFSNLQKQVGGLQELSKAAETFNKTAKAVDNLIVKEDKLAATLADLRAQQAASRAAVEQSRAAEVALTQQLEATKASASATKKEIAALASEQKRLAGTVGKNVDTQERYQRSIVETEAALGTLRTELSAARSVLDQQAASYDKLATAQKQVASAGVGTVVRAMQQQQQAVAQSVTAWRAAQQAANDYAKSLNFVGPRTRDQIVAFEQLKAASSAAKQEMLAQGAAMSSLSGTLTNLRSGAITLQQAQGQLAATQTQVANALKQVGAEAKKADAALTKETGTLGRVAAAQRQVAAGTKEAAAALRAQTIEAEKTAAAYKKLGLSQRTALSLIQRMRAEVLSLVAAYTGLFGAVRGVNSVIDAMQTLQNAQVRLNVSFRDRGGAVAAQEEMDRLSRLANNLGLNLGVVANQFSLFAASTMGTNISMQETEKIFDGVATASRVLGLSIEDQEGVFKALGQIASKGVVQMEELRGQLGDRLPGALQVMADGLGITVKELMDLTKQGKITADSLIPFGERLQNLYGPQLSEAMKTTTGLLGRLGNVAFNALVKIGESGFIETFNQFVSDLTKQLQSVEAAAFFEGIGESLSFVTKALGLLIDQFRLAFIAATTFFGAKYGVALGTVMFGLLGNFKNLITFIKAATTATAGLTIALRTAAISAAVLEGLLNIPNVIGAVVAVIGLGFALWVTHVNEASAALQEADTFINAVKGHIESMNDSTKKWADTFKEFSRSQAQVLMLQLATALHTLNAAIVENTLLLIDNIEASGALSDAQQQEIGRLNDALKLWELGAISAKDFGAALDVMAQKTAIPGLKEGLVAIQAALKSTVSEAEKLEVIQSILQDWQKSGDDTLQTVGELEGKNKELVVSNDEAGQSYITTGNEAKKAGDKANDALVNQILKASGLAGQIRKVGDEYRKVGAEAEAGGAVIDAHIKTVIGGVSVARASGEGAVKAMRDAAIAAGANVEAANKWAVANGLVLESINKTKAATAGAVTSQQTLTTEAVVAAGAVQDTTAAIIQKSEAEKKAAGEAASLIEDRTSREVNYGKIRADIAAEIARTNEEQKSALTEMATSFQKQQQALADAGDPFGTMAKNAAEAKAATEGLTEEQRRQNALIQEANESYRQQLEALNQEVQTIREAAASDPFGVKAAEGIETAKRSLEDLKAMGGSIKDAFSGFTNVFAGLGAAVAGDLTDVEASVRTFVSNIEALLARLKAAIAAAKAEANRPAPKQTSGGSSGGGGGIGHQSAPTGATATATATSAPTSVASFGGASVAMPRSFAPLIMPSFDLPEMIQGMMGSKAGPTRVLNLNIDGQAFGDIIAPEDVAAKLLRFAQSRKVRSAGRKPSWFT